MKNVKTKAFTLTEIIAVIVIVGIVIIIAIPASRRLMSNNDQEKIENKQKVVEKAMVTYAETDNRKMNCVIMTIQDLINNGYIKDSDLSEKYSDKAKQWYYYNGEIKDPLNDPLPDGVTCGIVASTDASTPIDIDSEEVVTVPELDENILNNYVLTVTKTGTDYGVTDKPSITMRTGSPSNLSVSCTTTDSCTLEGVPTGTAVTYTVTQKYYKAVSGYNLNGTIPSTESQATQTYEVKVQPKDIIVITNEVYSTNDLEGGIDLTPTTDSVYYPYTFKVKGRILSASASGTVITCNSSAIGSGYCYGSCKDATDYIKLGDSTYLMNQTFKAGTASYYTGSIFKGNLQHHKMYDCYRTYSVPTKNYTFANALSSVTISHNAISGHSLKLSYTYLPE